MFPAAVNLPPTEISRKISGNASEIAPTASAESRPSRNVSARLYATCSNWMTTIG
jgi:hypothetical protein